MELFNLDNKKIIPKAHTLHIKEFAQVWNRNKDKELSIKELLFVYYLADYKTSYLSTPPEEREQSIIRDLSLPSKWKPDQNIKEALRKYTELQKTPTMRFLDAQQSALEELITYMKNLDMSEKDKLGKPIHKYSDITKGMSDSARVHEALSKLQEAVRKEISIKDHTRGGSEKSRFEDPEDIN